MPYRRPLRITSGRHPFQVATVAAVPAIALGVAGFGTRPPALAGLPAPLEISWLAMCAIGGAGALAGAYWRGDVADGLILEAGALGMLAAALTLYVLLLALSAGANGLGYGGVTAGVAAAAWWRAGQICRDLMRLHRARTAGTIARLHVLAEGDQPGDRQ